MWKLPTKITVWGNVGPKIQIQTRFAGKAKNFFTSDENYRDSELGNIVKKGSKLTRKLREFPPKKDLERGFQPNKSKAFIPDETLKERLSFAPEEEFDETDYFKLDEGSQIGGLSGNEREPKLVIPDQRSPNILYSGDSWTTRAKGSRKRAVAVSVLKPGSGIITINDLPLLHYFPAMDSREHVLTPFLVTEKLGKFDLHAKVAGGGKSGIIMTDNTC